MMDRIENRILIGITTFVGIMILVGWIAINEGGRMQAFDRQFNARSIERGAALFASRCATCHNADARGIVGRAPALNNPQLFGFDYLAAVDDQINALTAEMAELEADLQAEDVSEERLAEIHARLGTGSIAAELYAASQPTQEPAAGEEAIPAGTETDVTPAAVEPTPAAEAEAVPATEGETAESTAEPVLPAQSLLQEEQTTLQIELAELQGELNAEGITEARTAELNARIAEINARLGTDSIPAELLDLNNQRSSLLTQMQAVVEKGYDPTQPDRLVNLGWAGGREAFIYTTLVHGRPVSGQYWPSEEAMPAWSQLAGGPLRNDQLQDLTNYILNFDKGNNWTLDDLFAVNQFAIVPGAAGGVVENPVCPDPATCDIAAVLGEMEIVTADPQNGQTLYNSISLGCIGCHGADAGIGPVVDGTWTRVTEVRLNDPALAGYTPEQYLVESILLPGNYRVPGFENAGMPTNFGQRVDVQMLADLIAYLESQDGPSPE